MKINRQKLPVKYALDVYSETPGFPSQTDLEYMLVSTLLEQNRIEAEFTAEHVWDYYKHCVGTISDLRAFLEQLFVDGAVDCSVQGHKSSSNSYIITGHAWMN